MKITGNIRKLKTELVSPIKYSLPIGEELLPINPLIGKAISFTFAGEINCVHCGRKIKKTFQQGYCYPCFQSLAECDSCLIKPELCHYQAGTCREPQWGEEHCFQDHYVYLANTSGLKVGITRQTNIPTRWIDQGATQALPIYRTRDRLLSGKVEVIMKQHVADKTAWQRMLKGEPEPVDIATERDRFHKESEKEINAILKESGEDAVTFLANEKLIEINYPIEQYPEKVKSFNFDKTPIVEGTLMGIKGQYLIFDTGVLNVRKFSGYNLTVSA